jgi:hypothetical protein
VPDDGVTFGYGGGYFTPGLQKTVNGVVFDRYLEGFAILNQGEPLTSRADCRTDAALHVLGHAIGLGDSDQSNAVMSRTLRASCTGLAQDDRDGLGFIYPPVAGGGGIPNPPTALTNSVALDTVTLSWTPAATGGTAQNYIVEASSQPGGPLIATLTTTNAATTLVVGGVQPGTYYVRVRAHNALGTSIGSTSTFSGYGALGTYYVRIAARNSCSTGPVSSPDLEVVVAACTAAPVAPANLRWTRNGNVVTLAWDAPATGILPSRYVIEAGSATGARDLLVFPTANNTTSFTASAAIGTYYVRVKGRNNCGDSAASNEVIVH